jgi:hypothetical protein
VGTWEQRTAEQWAYYVAEQGRPAGYVIRHGTNGDPAPLWEAIILSRPISTAIVAHHVPIARAKTAVEQNVTE